MQKYTAAQIVAPVAVFAGIIVAGYYNAWPQLGLERQEPHFTVAMIVTVLGLLVLAFLAIQSWLAKRKENKSRRANERKARAGVRDTEIWFEGEDTRHPDNLHLMSN